MNSELALPENLDDAQLRCWLIDKIETLDSFKRSIKAQLLSADRGEVRRDADWRDRATRKLHHLKNERERYRAALSEVNQRIRAARALKSRGGQEVEACQAFVELAQRHLAKEDFVWLWRQAEQAASQSAQKSADNEEGNHGQA